MAVAETRSAIVPLTGANYPTWKIQCKMALMKEGLWGIVSGTETAPAEGADGYTRFITRKDRALATIVLSVDPSLLYIIGDPTEPVTVWEKLSTQFQRKTWANKLALRRRLHSMQLKEGQSVKEHIKVMIEIFNELAVIGDNITDEDRVIYLLASLPESYEMLVTALEANTQVPNMETVTEWLLHEESKLKSREDLATSAEETLMAKYRKRGPRCHFCHKLGHIQKNCREREKLMSREGDRHKTDHSVNSAEFRRRRAETDSEDEIGLAFQHVFSAEAASQLQRSEWIVDSGASCHVCNNRGLFVVFENLEKPVDIILGDGHALNAVGRGTVILTLKSGELERRCKLHDILYVPKFSYNLLSVSKAVERGISFTFNDQACIIRDTKQRFVVAATKVGSLYHARGTNIKECGLSTIEQKSSVAKEDLWHRRYGHIGVKSLQKLARYNLVDKFDFCPTKELSFCEPCIAGKQSRSHFPSSSESITSEPLELVHSDLCGKLSTRSLSGAEYFVTFTDDKTRYVWVYVIRRKGDVFRQFCEWKNKVEKSLGRKVKTFRTDNGGEFTSNEFEDYLRHEGIKHEFTIPKCPEQNGVAERLNRTLVEMIRSMLADCQLPKSFWAEALVTATYIRNRSPTKAVEGKTPFEALYGEKPKVGHMRVFGCTAYSHIPKDERQKLDPKTRKCIFLGYPSNRKGYRLYDQDAQKVIYSRDVTFNELSISSEAEKESLGTLPKVDSQIILDDSNGECCSLTDTEAEQTDVNSKDSLTEETEPVIRRSQRQTRKPDYYGVQINMTNDSPEPNTVEEALSSPEKELWKEAMTAEFQSLRANQVWDLVPYTDDRRIVNSKWVFKRKLGEYGQIDRYKARLVAQGCSQREGIDYDETFSPVVRFESVRTVIAFAVSKGMKIHQMDVKTAFLNGELNEEVFMSQPQGFVEKGKESFVCCLRRSIYGLKQSPRCWNTALDSHMKSMKFVQTNGDPCLYVSSDGAVIVAVYVDDLMITGITEEKIQEVKRAIGGRFEVKDLGELHYFLAVKVVQDLNAGTVWLGQPTYAQNAVQQFNLENAKTRRTPLEASIKLTKGDETSILFDQELYQSAVGKLLYLSTRTRPDIAYAVNTVAKFTAYPTEQHWKAVKHIFRYLAGTINFGLKYSKTEQAECIGFSDADWGGDTDDRKSTSGYLFKVTGGPVSWRSKKQSCVALSTAEAEYMSLTLATQEAIWINRLLGELKLQKEPLEPVTVYEDNQSAICMTKNPQFHGRSKHVDIKYHFVRDEVKKGTINIQYCRSENMIADMLTKSLFADRFEKLRDMAGVKELKQPSDIN